MKTTRRNFMKTTAAAAGYLLVPTWAPLLKDQPFDIGDFCLRDGESYRAEAKRMTDPFAQADFTYATDARIVVRTTLIKADPSSDERRTPNAAGLMWAHDKVDRWTPWPRQNWVGVDNSRWGHSCPMCFGITPKDAKDCLECFGGGSTFDTYEREHRCESCNGRGWHGTVCDFCESRGSTHRPCLQPVDGVAINGWYDRKIRKLEGVEFSLVRFDEIADPFPDKRVVLFRFNGGQGIVAPVRTDI